MRIAWLLLLSAGMHAQTREPVCAVLFSDPPKTICASIADEDKAQLDKLRLDIRIASLEKEIARLSAELEKHRKSSNHAFDDMLESLNNLWKRINKMEEKRK